MMLNKVSLNTIGLNRIGLNRIGKPSRASSDRPYIDPEVLASLKAVCICYGKSNDDPDRAVVKNLVDPDNPFVISNAAYTEGSGYADKDSPYYGAFVTDGIDDLITSTKTVQEMDITDEVTVVSMIHQIDLNSTYTIATTNYIENSNSREHVRSDVYNYGKTGIYGYSASLINNTKSDIKNILGDVADYYVKSTNSLQTIFDAKFSVVGRISELTEASQVAWYWTIIANKVLTTDQINQVIAYFNLDRTLKPDILCDVKKQGITNENHAEFGDKLIDYSGNGRDIQLNNLAWDGDSGIGKYNYPNWKVTATIANTYSTIVNYPTVNGTYSINVNGVSELMQSIGLHLEIKYTTSTGIIYNDIKQDGVYSYILPDGATDLTLRFGGIPGIVNEPCNITITQIPSHAGALCLDGVNDFGQFVGDLGLKDYTLIMNRAYNNLINNQVPLISSNIVENQTPFIVEHWNTGSNAISFSYGASRTTDIPLDINKKIVYQSTYSYMGYVIPKGNAISTGNGITLGKFGNGVQYSAICLWSLMLFPYSMSEFLIERQLKKHKLGTLYPDMVEFRPVIKANNDYEIVYTAIIKPDNWQEISIGDYVTVGKSVAIQIKLNLLLEVTNVSSNSLADVSFYKEATGDNVYTIYGRLLDGKSPQKINITIDEYIRFEDIVQPYPVLLRFKDENGNEVSWGGKFRVGSTITRIGSAADSNLLPNIYNIFGLLLNGNQVTSSKVIVEKTMIFKAKSAYIFDNNEPKCILSPRLLRIPNSSYNILGHIPDISGHGNHGKINNSAYAGMSGANGYSYDYNNSSFWSDSNLAKVVSGELVEYFAVKNSVGFSNITSGVYKGKIKVTGVTKAISENKISQLRIYTNSTTDNELIDITQDGNYNIDIKGVGDANRVFFYAIPNNPNESIVVRLTEPIRIEQVGEHEGAYCFDGVDDFVTIPTIAGKQVLIKLNWQNKAIGNLIYDQRDNGSATSFAIMPISINDTTNNKIAYQVKNANGITYIDGIRNEYIESYSLENIIHNITITNPDVSNKTVVLGASNRTTADYFAKYALYDFMLFDNISTDDKIKELNEYVGIEAKVELPPYYWDTYGKTNSDADRDTIQQRGVAIGDYDLTNTNFAYDKMSGFGGYTLGKFTNSWSLNNNSNSISIVARNPYDITLKKLGGNSDWEFNTTELKLISNPVSVKFKSDKNIRFTCDYHYYTVGGNSEGAPLGITSKDLIANEDTIITISPISQENIDKYNIDINRGYYLIYFQLSLTLAVNEEVTIEMLPLYPNGLVYDGVDDYSKNENIPVLTDYTIIAKRLWINKDNPLNEQFIHKGAINTPISESAFMLEYEIANDTYYRSSSYGGYINIERSNRPERIVYQTSNSYNGTSITKGSGTDTTGIVIGGVTNNYWNGVFYKLMLYSKTLPLLQINYLKNLMERDEIIDLNNPIFIQK